MGIVRGEDETMITLLISAICSEFKKEFKKEYVHKQPRRPF